MNRQLWRIAGHVERTEIDGTAMLLDRKRGVYLGVNEVGTKILHLLATGNEVAEIVVQLSRLYGVAEPRLRKDVEAFVENLRQRALLEASQQDGNGGRQ